MKTLYVIEGQDRAGKDTLLKEIEKLGLPIFSPNTDHMPDYHNAEEFRLALKTFLEKQTYDMEHIPYNPLYIARFQLSEYVYSNLFNRPNLFEDYINELLEGKFIIKNFILLWDTYQDYLDRLNMIGDTYVEYTENEFNKIKNLYLKYKQENDVVFYVKANTSKEEILNAFIKTK